MSHPLGPPGGATWQGQKCKVVVTSMLLQTLHSLLLLTNTA